MPPSRNTGRSLPSFSLVVPGRGPSSRATSPSPVGTGTISRSNRPACAAATARWWLRSAKSSHSWRVIPSRSATSSAVSPIARVSLVVSGPAPSGTAASNSANRGLVNRQPSEVSATSPGRAQPFCGLAITHGARVMDSTPPATMTSASPARIWWAAEVMAVRPLAHNRLTV